MILAKLMRVLHFGQSGRWIEIDDGDAVKASGMECISADQAGACRLSQSPMTADSGAVIAKSYVRLVDSIQYGEL